MFISVIVAYINRTRNVLVELMIVIGCSLPIAYVGTLLF